MVAAPKVRPEASRRVVRPPGCALAATKRLRSQVPGAAVLLVSAAHSEPAISEVAKTVAAIHFRADCISFKSDEGAAVVIHAPVGSRQGKEDAARTAMSRSDLPWGGWFADA